MFETWKQLFQQNNDPKDASKLIFRMHKTRWQHWHFSTVDDFSAFFNILILHPIDKNTIFKSRNVSLMKSVFVYLLTGYFQKVL